MSKSYLKEGEKARLLGELAGAAALDGGRIDVRQIGTGQGEGAAIGGKAHHQLLLGGALAQPLVDAVVLGGKERLKQC